MSLKIIDADQMMALLKKHHFKGIKEMLAEAPEIVRCGECKIEQGCKVAQRLGENGFCAHGERKDNGKTDAEP